MDDEKRATASSVTGGIVFLALCFGMNAYSKLPFGTIFAISLSIGFVLAIIIWLALTLYDSYKKAKRRKKATTWELFKKEIFCKSTLQCLLVLTIFFVALILVVTLGLAVIGAAVFLLPLLKGAFKS